MRKLLPLLLLIVGLALFVFGIVRGVGGFVTSLSSIGEPWRAPGSVEQTLEPGTYSLYERVDTPVGQQILVTLDPDQVTVTGPQGSVPVTCVSCGASVTTVNAGQQSYQAVVSFRVADPGTYRIRVVGQGQEIVVGPSVTQTLGSSATAFGLSAIGGLLALAGAIWLIVELVTGGRRKAPIPTVGAAPETAGGWYPDPDDPDQLRWWDGTQWTENRQPRSGP